MEKAEFQMVRASVGNRIISKVIDLIVVFLAMIILPFGLGPFLGFVYSLVADGIEHKTFHGQSLGKKIMGLQVVNTVRGLPANYKDSVIRNAPVGFATFFGMIPIWGWIILALVGMPLLLIEIYLMIKVERAQRLGDVMADTEVMQIAEPMRAVQDSPYYQKFEKLIHELRQRK